MGARGGILASWVAPEGEHNTCALACGPGMSFPVLSHTGDLQCLAAPIAACRPDPPRDGGNGAELILSLAVPGRKDWDFELCAFGKQGLTPLRSTSALPKRPDKSSKAPAPQIRRLPGRFGPHTG